MLICYRCKDFKDESEFDKKLGARGYNKTCNECLSKVPNYKFKNKHPDRYNEIQKRKDRKSRGDLNDAYIRKFLRYYGLDNDTIYSEPQLLELQRNILLTKRLLKQKS